MYIDQLKHNQNDQRKTLLQFIYENPTFNSIFLKGEEQKQLSSLIIESLIQENVFVIFERLDEIPLLIIYWQ